MRAEALLLATSLLVTSAAASRSALASSTMAYSYEVENPEAYPDKVLVLWPRTCQASGKPLGSIDLALNPDWASRMNDVDYEVVVKGKAHGIVEHCVATARLFMLPASEFARGSRPSTADDSAIGQPEAGAAFAILPMLDAVDLKKRMELFESDPRVLRSAFQFSAPAPAAPEVRLRAVHDVLAVEGLGATGFTVVPKRAVYTYEGGATETRAYVGTARPEAPGSRAQAEAGVATSVAPEATSPVDAGGGADGAGSEEAGAGGAAASDRGTRFVYLAAVGGLLAGGLLAFYRKKQAQKDG